MFDLLLFIFTSSSSSPLQLKNCPKLMNDQQQKLSCDECRCARMPMTRVQNGERKVENTNRK
jgi:hypothetical protein